MQLSRQNMKELLIFPYNGNGLEALDCIQGQYRFIGFIDVFRIVLIDIPAIRGNFTDGVDAIFKVFPKTVIILRTGKTAAYPNDGDVCSASVVISAS